MSNNNRQVEDLQREKSNIKIVLLSPEGRYSITPWRRYSEFWDITPWGRCSEFV